MAFIWVTMFQLIPMLPVIKFYVDRIDERPSVVVSSHRFELTIDNPEMTANDDVDLIQLFDRHYLIADGVSML